MEASEKDPRQSAAPLSALLSDPTLLSRVREAVEKMSDSPAKGADQAAEGTPLPPAPSPDGILSLLSNPALLEKLPALLEQLPALFSHLSGVGGAPAKEAPEEGAAVPASLPGTAPPHRAGSTPRNDLLLALKPFLSRERCEAIDMIIRLSALGSILGKIL